ncbi:18207_t:CDS:1, partial [Entrophospora sp. SA101]
LFSQLSLSIVNIKLRELQREKVWSRIYLVPLLQAELDRDSYRRSLATLAKEEEIMKDVPGWKVGESVYNNKKRFIPPSIV